MSKNVLSPRSEIKTFSLFSRKYLNLLKELAISRFKLSEQSTILGFLWTLMYPVISVLIFYFLFSRNVGSGLDYFFIYLFIGVISWNLFANASSRGLGSLGVMREILKNSNIPFNLVVTSEVLVRFVSFGFEVVALSVLLFFFRVELSYWIFLVPFIFLLELLLVLSISFFLSGLNLLFSDMTHIWGLILNVLFFLTPIFYDPKIIIPEKYLWAYHLNPLVNIMNAFRDVILYARAPDLYFLAYTFGLCVLLLFSGFLFLGFFEKRLEEEL